MPIALTRAIRFAPGAVLRFTPTINGALLEALQTIQPRAAAILDAARAARITIESLGDDACCLRVAQYAVTLAAAAADVYTLRVAWADSASGSQRSAQLEGVAPMLGGKGDVFFAQRLRGENRFWLKLVYEADGAALYAFPAAFSERLPAVVRAVLPSQLALGRLERSG